LSGNIRNRSCCLQPSNDKEAEVKEAAGHGKE